MPVAFASTWSPYWQFKELHLDHCISDRPSFRHLLHLNPYKPNSRRCDWLCRSNCGRYKVLQVRLQFKICLPDLADDDHHPYMVNYSQNLLLISLNLFFSLLVVDLSLCVIKQYFLRSVDLLELLSSNLITCLNELGWGTYLGFYQDGIPVTSFWKPF